MGTVLAAAETAVRNGAELKRGSAVAGVEDLGNHYVVHTASGNYESRYLVNCAGVMPESAPWSERANGCLNTHAESTICWISPAAIWSTM